MANKLLRIVETTKAKDINHRCLPAHNINKASDTMVDQLRAFIYTVGISENNPFQVFIPPQVVASLATSVDFSLARARVGRENKGVLACTVVPGQ
jgi:hypothetical protein